MNKENTRKLWKIIQEAGDYLAGQLQPSKPSRESYAHVAICVKINLMSYKDIPNEN